MFRNAAKRNRFAREKHFFFFVEEKLHVIFFNEGRVKFRRRVLSRDERRVMEIFDWRYGKWVSDFVKCCKKEHHFGENFLRKL